MTGWPGVTGVFTRTESCTPGPLVTGGSRLDQSQETRWPPLVQSAGGVNHHPNKNIFSQRNTDLSYMSTYQ